MRRVGRYKRMDEWIQFCERLHGERRVVDRCKCEDVPSEEIGLQCCLLQDSNVSLATVKGMLRGWKELADMNNLKLKCIRAIYLRNAFVGWRQTDVFQKACLKMNHICPKILTQHAFDVLNKHMVHSIRLSSRSCWFNTTFSAVCNKLACRTAFVCWRSYTIQLRSAELLIRLETIRNISYLRSSFKLWKMVAPEYVRPPSKYIKLNYRAVRSADSKTKIVPPSNKKFHDSTSSILKNRINDSKYLLSRAMPTAKHGLWKKDEVILTKSFTPKAGGSKTYWV